MVFRAISEIRLTVWTLVLPIVLVAPLLGGCGSGDPYGVIPVSGTVKYDDGSLIEAAQILITFIPQAEPVDSKTFPRPGITEANTADGTFDNLCTYGYGDGVILGEHKVTIKALDANEGYTQAMPLEYIDVATTPLTVTVASGSTTFDFKIPKPKGN